MKKILLLLVLFTSVLFISCEEEQLQTDCNCQVEGSKWTLSVTYLNGIQHTQSSHIELEPYDTIVNCNQNQITWEIKNVQQLEAGYISTTISKTINCD
jgi:hypothetical protein